MKFEWNQQKAKSNLRKHSVSFIGEFRYLTFGRTSVSRYLVVSYTERSNRVRGKHSRRFREGANVVLIAPDLHEIFPDSKSVDKALRAYLSQTS